MSTVEPPARAAALLDRWYVAWNQRDVAAIANLVCEDIVYEAPTASLDVFRGRRAVELYARFILIAVPDLEFEKLEEWVGGNGEVVYSYFKVTGTTRTGDRIDSLGMDRSEIAAGRLARHQIFWDGRMYRLLLAGRKRV